jgi:hypothetical protein
MLVQSQREILSKLKNGEIKDDDELKNARRSMRKYVIRQLDSMSDLLEVMEVLGPDQLGGMGDKGHIGPGHIAAAVALTGELIKILDLPGIQPVPCVHLQTGKVEAVRRFSPAISEPLFYGGDKISSIVFAFHRDATPEEIATRDALEDLSQQITNILSPAPRRSDLSLSELIAEGSKKWPDMRTRIDEMTSDTPAPEEEESTATPDEG